MHREAFPLLRLVLFVILLMIVIVFAALCVSGSCVLPSIISRPKLLPWDRLTISEHESISTKQIVAFKCGSK